jgi:hypothetical protein
MLAPGSHTITAIYSGAAQFAGSSASIIEVVTPSVIAPTTTTITSSLNPAQFGQSVTFAATVSAGGTPATGQISFSDGATPLKTATLDATGAATLTTSTLAVGSHTITASYAGNAQFAASSRTMTEVINAVMTSTTLTSSLNPSQSGQSVTFTATVAAASGVPTGTVNFLDGGAALGSGSLSPQGIATFSTSGLSVGTHTITAAYQGDALFTQSTSAALAQVVQAVVLPGDFALQIAPPTITVLRGELASYTVTLVPENGFNGTVNFTCNVGGAPGATCNFDPAAVTGSGITTLFVPTAAAHPNSALSRSSRSTLVMASLICCLLLRRKKWQSTAFLLVALFAGMSGLSGCGSNGSLGTPPGNYTVTVIGTSTSGGTTISHAITAQLKVT